MITRNDINIIKKEKCNVIYAITIKLYGFFNCLYLFLFYTLFYITIIYYGIIVYYVLYAFIFFYALVKYIQLRKLVELSENYKIKLECMYKQKV